MKRWAFLMFGLGLICAMAASGIKASDLPAHAQIRNVGFNLLLRPLNASSKVGAPIVLYSEAPWKCMTWTLGQDRDTVVLTNVLSKKPFAAAPDSKQRQLFQASRDTKTAWQFEPLKNGEWKIIDSASGKVLTATDADHVILAPWSDTAPQKWRIEPKELSDLTM